MRPFTPKMIALAACMSVAPFAGAYAATGHGGPGHSGARDEQDGPVFQGPRLEAVLDQANGINVGIADARQGKDISTAEAQVLHMRAARVVRTAENVAANDHGRIPAAQYDRLLHRLDLVDLHLQVDTGVAFNIGTPLPIFHTSIFR